MEDNLDVPLPPMDDGPLEEKAKESLTLGMWSVLFGLLPLISFPLAIFGIIIGNKGKRSLRRRRALLGVTLSWTGLILVILSSFFWLPYFYELSGPSGNELVLSKVEYKDYENYFSITPPQNWKSGSRESATFSSDIAFTAPKKEWLGKHVYTPTIIVSENEFGLSSFGGRNIPKTVTSQILSKLQNDLITNGLGNIKPTSQNVTITTVNGNEALKFEAINKDDKSGVILKVVGLIVIDTKAGSAYVIMAAAPESRFDKYQILYDQVLGSFTLD
jgi:hypothetical protein